MPRNLLRIGLWAALFSGAAVAQSTLSGRVAALSDGDSRPAAGAWVIALSGSPPRTIASAQADAQGAYRLAGLPEGRVEFTVSQRGYFTLEAGGATSATLARSCPASGSCGEADFVIAKASVVEGHVTDPFGDPLPDAVVQLAATEKSPALQRRGPGGGFGRPLNSTDDRGYFRFYGVTPGEYQLEVQAGRFFVGEIYSAEPLDIAVELGRSSSPLYIAMSIAAEPVRIGGVIDGLNLEGGETVYLMAANVNPGASRRPVAGIQVETESEGAPRLSGQLPAGDYVLTAQIVDSAAGSRRAPSRIVTLGRYRIDSDLTDLRLTARQGASFSGQIDFEDMTPRRVNLGLVPLDGGTPNNMRVGGNGRFQGGPGFGGRGRPDNTRFERSALLPGRYRLNANSNDYFIASQTEFTLSEGQTLQADIVLSGAFGEVRGIVRSPAEDAGSGPFVVALRDAAGKVVSIQTDVKGQYSFPKLFPGEYQICSWADASVNPQSEQAWNAAGSAVKRFPIAAGDRTEILLTAKP